MKKDYDLKAIKGTIKVPNNLAYYSIPLLIKENNKYYGIYIVSCVIKKLFTWSYKRKPYYIIIFNLEDGKIVKEELYSKNIMNYINEVYHINKIEDMYLLSRNYNKEDEFYIRFSKIVDDYLMGNNILDNYKEYIEHFLIENKNASKEKITLFYN